MKKKFSFSFKRKSDFSFRNIVITYLTPAEVGDSLQNLIVILISCGINRPKPFFKGALAFMNPSFKNNASVISM